MSPLRWWLGRPFRLTLLLTCLAAATVALLSARTDVFSSVDASTAGPHHACQAREPALAEVHIGQIAQLRASLLGVIAPLASRRYAWGTVSPEVAWSDDSPRSLMVSRLPGGLYPGSFEMRVWAESPALYLNGVNTVADVFAFADSSQAQRFFIEAASAHCHRYGTAQPAPQPPQARNLTWANPDGASQNDVFLLRGARVYRVADAPPDAQSSPAATQQASIATIDRLACALPQAGCSNANATAGVRSPRGASD